MKFTQVDLTKKASLGMRYQIETVPTLLVFKDGLLAEILHDLDGRSFIALETKMNAYCEPLYHRCADVFIVPLE